jgi:type IV pilus assembly protein PilV
MMNARGFTVVEVLIAVLILSVGLLGLVGTAAVTTRMIGQGHRYSEASALAAQRFEMLRSQPCPSMSGGSTSEGRFVVTWTLQTVASGRAQAVTLVVESPTTRAMRADSFATTIPC